MRVIRCDDTFRERWNAFIDAGHGTFYHRFEWREINQHAFSHATCYLAALEGDRVEGVLPLVRVKSVFFGNIGCSLPFVNYGGPVAVSAEAEAALLAEAERVAGEWDVDYLEIRNRQDLGARYPTSLHKVSMTIALGPDPDVLWTRFKTGHRQDIRKAYKHGFAAKIGGRELLDDFYAVLSETWRDMGTPLYRKSYLESVLDAFPGAIRVSVVYAGDDLAAASFDGIQGDTIEGMWLGTRARYRHQLAGYVLYWENIKDGCQRGLRHYHLGRSTVQSGGEIFKKKWNAEPLQLHWQYLLRTRRTIPDLNVTNPKYGLAIKAWKKLPVPVAQVVGPMIARSIP